MKFFAAFRLYSENQTHECFQHFNRIEIISLTVWKLIMLEKLPVFCHSGCGFRDDVRQLDVKLCAAFTVRLISLQRCLGLMKAAFCWLHFKYSYHQICSVLGNIWYTQKYCLVCNTWICLHNRSFLQEVSNSSSENNRLPSLSVVYGCVNTSV